MQSKIYAIPQHIMTGTGVALFDHIAECLANFMKVKHFYSIHFMRDKGQTKVIEYNIYFLY